MKSKDVLISIFCFFDNATLSRARCVCKKWKTTVDSTVKLRNLYEMHLIENDDTGKALKQYCQIDITNVQYMKYAGYGDDFLCDILRVRYEFDYNKLFNLLHRWPSKLFGLDKCQHEYFWKDKNKLHFVEFCSKEPKKQLEYAKLWNSHFPGLLQWRVFKNNRVKDYMSVKPLAFESRLVHLTPDLISYVFVLTVFKNYDNYTYKLHFTEEEFAKKLQSIIGSSSRKKTRIK